jgi:hypothetical protein
VRPPPKLETPPNQIVFLVVSGVLLLILGLFSELGTRPRPLVPITFVPGFAFICAGAGFGMAVFDRYFPRFSWAYFLPAVWIFLAQSSGGNSALPILLYAGLYQVARAVLRLVDFGE